MKHQKRLMVNQTLIGALEIQSLMVIKTKMMINLNINTERGTNKKYPWKMR